MIKKHYTIPLFKKSSEIHNYTQIIADLKEINSRYPNKSVPWRHLQDVSKLPQKIKNLGIIFTDPSENLSIDTILNGFVQQKVKDKFKKYEKEVLAIFNKETDEKIKNLKRKLEMKNTIASTLSETDVSYIEENLEDFKTGETFKNEMLRDVSDLLARTPQKYFKNEISFLEKNYITFVKKFYYANVQPVDIKKEECDFDKKVQLNYKQSMSVEDSFADKTIDFAGFPSLSAFEKKVTAFCRLKYNRFDYEVEVYEDRYIYAELYTLLRCGLVAKARKLLKTTVFGSEFSEIANAYLDNPNKIYAINAQKAGDHFKSALILLFSKSEAVLSSNLVETLEDYLWFKMCLKSEFKFDEIDSESKNGDKLSTNAKFLFFILTQRYEKAAVLLLSGNFDTKDAFYLGKKLQKIKKCEIFVEFACLICKQFKAPEKKGKLIEMIYYKGIEKKIIDHHLIDGVAYLSPSLIDELIQKMKIMGEKKSLLKLCFLNNDVSEALQLMEDSLCDEITSNRNLKKFEEFEFYETYSYLVSKKLIEKDSKVAILKGFLDFKIEKNVFFLLKSHLFNENLFGVIKEIYCLDIVISIAGDIIFESRDCKLARKLVELIGKLELVGNVKQGVLKQLLVLL